MATVSAATVALKLAASLGDLMYGKINKRAKKQDVLKATLTEVATQLVGLEARIARLEQFTKMLDMDQDQIPDSIESLVKSRQRDIKASGLELR